MLIRTQDRTELINLNHIIKIFAENKRVRIDTVDNEIFTTIGKYSTDEKALKVLDIIEDRYNNLEMAKANKSPKHFIPFVYDMPQEDEI